MNVFMLKSSGMEVAVSVLIVTLFVLICAIVYQKILARIKKKRQSQQKYCILYSLEQQPAQKNVQFYFTAEEKKHVSFSILDENYQIVRELYSQICRLNGNIIDFDTLSLENGTYFYCLKTDNQKTTKKMIICNEVLK